LLFHQHPPSLVSLLSLTVPLSLGCSSISTHCHLPLLSPTVILLPLSLGCYSISTHCYLSLLSLGCSSISTHCHLVAAVPGLPLHQHPDLLWNILLTQFSSASAHSFTDHWVTHPQVPRLAPPLSLTAPPQASDCFPLSSCTAPPEALTTLACLHLLHCAHISLITAGSRCILDIFFAGLLLQIDSPIIVGSSRSIFSGFSFTDK
jgi:hypothetical protein